MSNFALVAVGYNRLKCLERLLKSLENAEYNGNAIDLYISIDNSDEKSVENFAQTYKWSHGEKKVITYQERQGLKNHILKCGDLVYEYDAIAVFEDDVIVSKGFYSFFIEAYEKYCTDSRVIGLSLYNYSWNENVVLPFEAAYSKFDSYFIQMSQSWGQVWFKDQWNEFRKWYEKVTAEMMNLPEIPMTVRNWPDSSWKKYHIAYCILKNKYMVYPYKSLATCYSEIGEHCKRRDTYLQVPLLTSNKINYDLPTLDDEYAIKYDAFFERIYKIQIDDKIGSVEVCFDLYGSKESYENKRYLVSTKALPYKIIAEYGLLLKPHEENVINQVEGNDVRLYDTAIQDQIISISNKLHIFKYRYNLYDKTKMMILCVINNIINRKR